MKKLLYLLVVTLYLSVKSQITLESTPLGKQFVLTMKTSNLSEEKYVVVRDPNSTIFNGTDTMWVYNSDWTLYRQLILPVGYEYDLLTSLQPDSYFGGSDNLFNSDSLIEFIVSKQNYNDNYTVSIINEVGQTIFTFPDSIEYGQLRLIKINNVFKITYNVSVFQNGNTNPGNSKVYSLPGTLPCVTCNFTSGIVEPNQVGGLSGLNVYPNPFNNSLEINYNFLSKQDNPRLIISDILGRELKTIQLVNQSDKITLNTTDLPRGTMIVSLYGNNQNPVSKKVIKIN